MQVMVMLGQKELLSKAMDFFIRNTLAPSPVIPDLKRESVYHIYERYFCDDAIPLGTEPAAACGPLNIVCVAEILKVSRMIAGIGSDAARPAIRPFLPDGWTGFRAHGIPCLHNGRLVNADITYQDAAADISYSDAE